MWKVNVKNLPLPVELWLMPGELAAIIEPGRCDVCGHLNVVHQVSTIDEGEHCPVEKCDCYK